MIIWLSFINMIGFLLMAIDKRRAQKKKWRIKENTLMFIAMIGGSFGMMMAMYIFRHKTKHFLFRYGLPILFLIQLGFVLYFFHLYP